jgi:hypothetical protein
MEHEHIYPNLKSQEIIVYYKFVDDILIIYGQKRNTAQTFNEVNNIQPSIKLTIEKRQDEKINYLDIIVHRKNKKLEFSIYRFHQRMIL